MQLEILPRAEALDAADWAALERDDDPFISRDFLGAAENSGAAGPDYAWQAAHAALRDPDGDLLGLLPLYLRHHSFGDFSHDWHWGEAWAKRGLAYYPKLVSGAPFTPSPGPRLLTAKAWNADTAFELARAAQALTTRFGASSWQCLFAHERELPVLREAGLLLRRDVQFHWRNAGYRDFADFLDGFSADKRKKLKRERRAVAEAGLRLETRHGDAIDEALWPAIHRHYRDTFARHGNHPAFSLDFFRDAARRLGRRFVVFLAWEGDAPIASAICYRNAQTLFGRHWGADRHIPGLHFELCYHQGVEYAIAQGLTRFEPGAQGEHKLARGFEPVATWSGFWIADPDLRALLARHLAREEHAMLDYQSEMAARLPFKAG